MNVNRLTVATFALVCIATAALAQIVTDPDVAPDWIRRPSAGELNAVWPANAAKKGLGGRAVIVCKLSAQGALYDCVTQEETPAGMGFGQAAIALTPQMAFRPAMKGGKPVAIANVRIPVNFKNPPAPPTPGQSELPPGSVATGIRWSDGPSFADVVAAYPEKARQAKLGGQVSLECYFNKEGRVRNCQSMTEAPRSYGFSAAAKALSVKFQGPKTWSDGKSIAGARVDLKFTFSPDMLDPQVKPVTGKPVWLKLPTSEQLMASLPEEARKAGVVQARVMLSCIVQPLGRVGNCKAISEDPAGHGVGLAATALSEHFVLASWSAEGLPTIGGEVRIPLRYDFGPAKPGEPAKP